MSAKSGERGCGCNIAGESYTFPLAHVYHFGCKRCLEGMYGSDDQCAQR